MRLFIPPSTDYVLNASSLTILSEEELQNRSLDEEPFIVSNVPTDHAYILAPEINFYIHSSNDINEEKLNILYKARELSFEYLEIQKQLYVDNSLFVIGTGRVAEDFCLYANQNGFDCVLLAPSQVISIGGSLGKFTLLFDDESTRNYAQGVLFVDIPKRQKGVETVADFEDRESLLQTLKNRLGNIEYNDILHFDSTFCQYEGRREKCCCACAEVCPTFGIYNDDSEKKLHFSSIDCIQCGLCLSVCPTGAIEFKEFPRTLFLEIARLYRGYAILLLDNHSLTQLQNCDIHIPEYLLPLIVPEINALTPLYLLNLIQESGYPLIVYKDNFSTTLLESVEIVNILIQKGYKELGIYAIDNLENLQHSLLNIKSIHNVQYLYVPRDTDHNRTIFAERLRYIIKDKDLGHLPSYEHLRYGQIHIKDGCTLCLSCVGACNVGALNANEHNFTLTFNPSLCTTCEYCLLSCPENVMILERSGIALNAQWFESRILAQDKPFKCVECGTAYATTASITKIKNMLLPKFGNDERKIRTLECCPDCKVKIMAKGMM